MLVGEATWSRRIEVGRAVAELIRKADRLPQRAGRPVVLALWAPVRSAGRGRVTVHSPGQVLRVLR